MSTTGRAIRRGGVPRSFAELGDPRRLASLAIVTVLAAAATFGFRSLTSDWAFAAPAVIGALVSALVVELGHRARLLLGEVLAASIVVFVVTGALVTGGGLPTPSAFGSFFDGLTGAWADVLASVTPIEATAELRVAPFTLAWFGALVGGTLLRWGRPPGIAIVGPLVTLVMTVLLTEEDRALSIALGTAMAVGAIALGLIGRATRSGGAAFRDEPDHVAETTAGGTIVPRRSRIARTTVALAVVALAAPWVGPRLPLAEARERFDLRDQLVPPWDPLSVPSPLVQLKASLAEDRQDDVVFRVESDEPIARWSLAAMGSYDGVVWTVASPDGVAEREFRPVGPRLPTPEAQSPSDPVQSATVTVVDLPGPWLPSPGWPVALEIDDRDGEGVVVRENTRTGTLAIAEGLPSGTSYRVDALAHPARTDAELLAAQVPELDVAVDLEVLPPQIRNLTADITQGIDRGWGQAVALRDRFAEAGFYDSSELTTPGHSYYRLALFLADADRVVGYEEQYAATAAVMARIVGLPSRVVVGYVVPPDRYVDGVADVLAGDVSAWVEVLVDDVGWIPLDVTPPRTREPESDVAPAPREQVATPNPPPPPQVPPDIDVVTDNRDVEDLVEDDEDDDEDDDEADEIIAAGRGWAAWALFGAGGVTTLLVLLALAVLAAKAWRTHRRRHAPEPPARIAGAWFEFGDRYQEAGIGTPARSTPLELARAAVAAEPALASAGPALLGLVDSVDRAAYHVEPPADDDAERAWRSYDAVLASLMNGRSRARRARMRLDPRPLLRRRPDAWRHSTTR